MNYKKKKIQIYSLYYKAPEIQNAQKPAKMIKKTIGTINTSGLSFTNIAAVFEE